MKRSDFLKTLGLLGISLGVKVPMPVEKKPKVILHDGPTRDDMCLIAGAIDEQPTVQCKWLEKLIEGEEERQTGFFSLGGKIDGLVMSASCMSFPNFLTSDPAISSSGIFRAFSPVESAGSKTVTVPVCYRKCLHPPVDSHPRIIVAYDTLENVEVDNGDVDTPYWCPYHNNGMITISANSFRSDI